LRYWKSCRDGQKASLRTNAPRPRLLAQMPRDPSRIRIKRACLEPITAARAGDLGLRWFRNGVEPTHELRTAEWCVTPPRSGHRAARRLLEVNSPLRAGVDRSAMT
jgi:hypothetical protein